MKRRGSDVRELLRLAGAGLATPEVVAELHEAVSRDRDGLREYVRAMHLQASLAWLLDGQAPGEEAVRSEVLRTVRSRRRRWLWRGASAAVAASVLLGLGAIEYFRRSVVDTPVAGVVGTIETAHKPQWAGNRGEREGSLVRAGVDYHLLAGLVEIRFEKGATVSLEGPARLRVDSADRVTLGHGKLLADVPPKAVGFTVRTPAAEAVDLGTCFGVVVAGDGAPEFHVLSGKVRADSGRLAAELLTTNEASRYAADGATRREMPASRKPFDACLRLAAGVAGVSGQVKFEASPPPLVAAQARGVPNAMTLFAERKNVPIPDGVTTLSIEPGEFRSGDPTPPTPMLAGVRVDGYFVHVGSSEVTPVRGEITFARPVVAVIVDPPSLNATDTSIGLPGFDYLPAGCAPENRGALLAAAGRMESGDVLALSPDRRTVTLHLTAGQLTAGPSFIDQIRILVEPDPAPAADATPAAIE